MKPVLALAFALIGSTPAFASDFSAADLALHPSCVVYASDSGPRAQIAGSAIWDGIRPEVGLRQQFVVDGRSYEAITGPDGIYSADVPVFSAHPTMKETRAFDSEGRPLMGSPGRAHCITPHVNVGPAQSVAPAPSAPVYTDGLGSTSCSSIASCSATLPDLPDSWNGPGTNETKQ